MHAHAEHVHAEPRETGHDIAEERHYHQAALPDESTPARMQSDCAPKHDQHRAILFRVPAPEAHPGLISPDTAENCADETEERCKAQHSVSHAGERIRSLCF